MTSLRLVLAIVAGFLLPGPLPADTAATTPPFEMAKQYSADLTITTNKNMVIQSKAFIDGEKMRSDVSMNGMSVTIIVRKDQKKIYQIMNTQKMVMISDFNPGKNTAMRAAAAFGPDSKYELIGPDTIDGIACTKYKVTSDGSKQVYFFWLDNAHKVPYEMASDDGGLIVKWANFVPGPQDAGLFEVPAGYQAVEMPDGMGMPGGPGGDQ